MKTKIYFLSMMLIATALAFNACSSDDDNVPENKVPEVVKETFNQMFPTVKPKWEMEFGMYKAEWKENGFDVDAWFKSNGSWQCTDRDILPSELPQTVINYINTNYPGYIIDDVDYMETPDGNYYDIELEKAGSPDIDLMIAADGTVISQGFEPWNNTDGDIPWSKVPKAVQQTFAQMYPNINAEWEIERGMYKAEWKVNGRDVDALFKKDGTWVMTKSDVSVTALPTAVTTYVSTNYPDYYIDDADFIEKPDGNYYLLELEKNGYPDIYLSLTADGKPLS